MIKSIISWAAVRNCCAFIFLNQILLVSGVRRDYCWYPAQKEVNQVPVLAFPPFYIKWLPIKVRFPLRRSIIKGRPLLIHISTDGKKRLAKFIVLFPDNETIILNKFRIKMLLQRKQLMRLKKAFWHKVFINIYHQLLKVYLFSSNSKKLWCIIATIPLRMSVETKQVDIKYNPCLCNYKVESCEMDCITKSNVDGIKASQDRWIGFL